MTLSLSYDSAMTRCWLPLSYMTRQVPDLVNPLPLKIPRILRQQFPRGEFARDNEEIRCLSLAAEASRRITQGVTRAGKMAMNLHYQRWNVS